MTRVVLASASPGRLSILRNAGIDPLVIVSGVDENAVIAEHKGAPPGEVVRALAAAKADEAAGSLPPDVADDCVVIGCDSMLYVDGQLRGKPGKPEAALAQWQSMGGQAGQLYTGHAVLRIDTDQIVGRESETSSTTVHFADIGPDDLTAYVASGEPLGVAGGFTIDGLGGWFVERIEGDPSNVIGLSLPLTRKLLERLGLPVTTLWSAER